MLFLILWFYRVACAPVQNWRHLEGALGYRWGKDIKKKNFDFKLNLLLLQHLTGDRGEGGLGLVGRQLVSYPIFPISSILDSVFLWYYGSHPILSSSSSLDSIYIQYFVSANLFWQLFSQKLYSWYVYKFLTYHWGFQHF